MKAPCSLLVLLASLFSVARLAAAEPPAEVSLRFLFLDETPGAYSLKTGATFRQLSATPYAIGRPVLAKPAARLELFKDGPAPDPLTGKTIRLKIATVTAPADTPAALVVLTPRPGAPDAPVYDVAFYNNDPRDFPARSIRILNLGHAPVAAQFGSAQVVTPPGSSRVVQPAPDPRSRVFGKIAVQTSAGWELLCNRMTLLRATERVTGVFVYSPGGLRHTYTAQELEERGPPAPGHFWLTYGEML